MKRRKKALLERTSVLRDELVARPLRVWHEENGIALWWSYPIREAPYVGRPDDEDFPPYCTHWTPLVMPLIAVNQ